MTTKNRSKDMIRNRVIYLTELIRRERESVARLAANAIALPVATELAAAVGALDAALRKLEV